MVCLLSVRCITAIIVQTGEYTPPEEIKKGIPQLYRLTSIHLSRGSTHVSVLKTVERILRLNTLIRLSLQYK